MASSVTPEQRQLLIAGYVLCDLSPQESAVLNELLTTDPSVMAEIEQMQRTVEMTYMSEVLPPEHLKTSILSAYQVVNQLDHVAAEPPSHMAKSNVIRPHWWRRGLGAVAAVLIVGLSISNYVMWQSLQTLQVNGSQAEELVFALAPTANHLTSSVTVVVDPRNLEATLNVQDLPSLEPGKIYALWTVVQPNAPVTTDEKHAILTAVFTVNAQGDLSKRIAVPSIFRDRHLVKAVAITIEDKAAPQRHRSSPILLGQLEAQI